jgi:hypothetical protein
MNCDAARDALLDVDLPIDDTTDLARHLRECNACGRIVDRLAGDLAVLRAAVQLRARRRRRRLLAAATLSIAAASTIVAFVHARRGLGETRPAVNAAPAGVVSVQVPPNKMATVLQTKDPNVTIVWLTDEPRGGI